MTKNLTAGPPVRLILMFTLPLLIGNLFQQAYSFTDAAVVGRLLGVNALAAVGASGAIQFFLIGFAIGASTGLAIPVARAFGAGDLAAVRRRVAAGMFISIGIAAGITLVGTLGARTVLGWMDTPAELIHDSTVFLVVLSSGSAALVAFNFLSAVIQALGDSRTPLLFLVISCLINAGLVVLFVGGMGMGVGGAAAATVVAQGLSVALCLVLIQRRMPILRLHRADLAVSGAELRESLRLGLTLGFQMSVIATGAAILQYGVNKLGPDTVAAFTVALRVDQMAVAPLASVGVAMTTYVAQNRGAARNRRIRVGVFRMTLITTALGILLGGIIYLWGEPMVRLFVGDQADAVVQMAHRYLVINSALYWLLAILFLLRNAVQGLGSTAIPTLAGVMELLVRSVVGLLLIGQIGFLGVCIAAPLAWFFALLPVLVAWVVLRRRLVGDEEAVEARARRETAEAAEAAAMVDAVAGPCRPEVTACR
jgi:putative MATE family efflux protein